MSITLSVNADNKQRPGVWCAAILSYKNACCFIRDEKLVIGMLCDVWTLPYLMISAKYSGKQRWRLLLQWNYIFPRNAILSERSFFFVHVKIHPTNLPRGPSLEVEIVELMVLWVWKCCMLSDWFPKPVLALRHNGQILLPLQALLSWLYVMCNFLLWHYCHLGLGNKLHNLTRVCPTVDPVLLGSAFTLKREKKYTSH